MDGLVNMADQFKGLPMQDLIGGPLDASTKANVNLAQATADYINNVGFLQIIDPATKKVTAGAARMVDFDFERPGTSVDANGKPIRTIEAVKLRVPILSIVPIPNLQVDQVDITFDMEVKSATSEKSSKDEEGSLDATAKVGWGPFSVEVKIHGSVATHQENTRTSDNSAKYHVEVKATNHGIPEGLARVLDILASAAAPTNIKAAAIDPDTGDAKRNAGGGIDAANQKAVAPDGTHDALPPAK